MAATVYNEIALEELDNAIRSLEKVGRIVGFTASFDLCNELMELQKAMRDFKITRADEIATC